MSKTIWGPPDAFPRAHVSVRHGSPTETEVMMTSEAVPSRILLPTLKSHARERMCVCVCGKPKPLRASRQGDHSSNSIIDHQRGKTAWQRTKLSQNSGEYFLFSPDATHPLHSAFAWWEKLHMAASPAPHHHLPKVPIFSARRACPLTPPRGAILSRVTLPFIFLSPISHTHPFHWETRRVLPTQELCRSCVHCRCSRDTSTHTHTHGRAVDRLMR